MNNDSEYMQAYSHYQKEHDRYEAFAFEMAGRAGRWNLTITGGALVLSITFLGSVASALGSAHLWVLGLGWALLSISLGALLWAQVTSQSGLEWECGWNKSRMNDPLTPPPKYENPYWKRVKLQRNVALITCVSGIMILAAFAYLSASIQTAESYVQSKRETTETQGQPSSNGVLHDTTAEALPNPPKPKED